MKNCDLDCERIEAIFSECGENQQIKLKYLGLKDNPHIK